MRTKLANSIRKYFKIRLMEELPQFKEIKSSDIPPGFRLYSWEVGSDLSFFLLLVLFKSRDWFTLEAAWSQKRCFPAFALPSLPNDNPRNGELRFRLHTLWDDPRVDFWWKVSGDLSIENELEQYKHKSEEPFDKENYIARSHVDEAIKYVVKFAMPYFHKIAAEYGIELQENP